MDKYDFMSVVDDTFKECKNLQEITDRYTEMLKALRSLYVQNLNLIDIYNNSTIN